MRRNREVMELPSSEVFKKRCRYDLGTWFSGEHGAGPAVGLHGLFQPKQLFDSLSAAA